MPKLQPAELVNNKPSSNNFYAIPQDVADIVFKELGTKPAQLRIMLVLIGTKTGFKPSEEWMLERTGLTHSSYIRARKELCDMGWLLFDPYKRIEINYDKMCGEPVAATPSGNTVIPKKEDESFTF